MFLEFLPFSTFCLLLHYFYCSFPCSIVIKYSSCSNFLTTLVMLFDHWITFSFILACRFNNCWPFVSCFVVICIICHSTFTSLSCVLSVVFSLYLAIYRLCAVPEFPLTFTWNYCCFVYHRVVLVTSVLVVL